MAIVLLSANNNLYAKADQSLRATEDQNQATLLITHFISNYHYKKTPLDDALSEKILDMYLNALDPNRSYFLADDIKKFDAYKTTLDDSLKSSDLMPGFQIYEVFQTRLEERIQHALDMIDYEFDFNSDEEYFFDRSDLPWAASTKELDDLWRKRVENDILSLRIADKPQAEIADTLSKRYELLLKRNTQVTPDDIYQLFMNAYASAIEPHTAYFSPRTYDNFEIRMSLSLEGIGAMLRTEGEHTVIQEVIPGGPAEKSTQLHAEDRIVGVSSGETAEIIDVVGWRLDDVVDMIRGPKGTTVRLRILAHDAGPEGPAKEVSLVRNEIKLEEQAAQKSVIEIPAGSRTSRIGVIKIPTFYLDFDAVQRGETNFRSTTHDVKQILAELAQDNVDGIIIDLRDNGGGPLTEATEMTGLFLKSGPIVQVKDSTGHIEIEEDPDSDIDYSGPLAVLVNRNSASASEIFSGAIQDYKRGIIIGERTYGKGTVQQLVDLDRFSKESTGKLGQLKATIAQFFRVSGGSTQNKGVIPDVEITITPETDDEGERALENALPWNEIKPARFSAADISQNALTEVRKRHIKRIADDPAFQILVAQAMANTQSQEKKSITLNAVKRRAEYDNEIQSKRERRNDLRAAYGLEPLDAKKAEEESKDESDIDVVLDESAFILSDFLHATQKAGSIPLIDSDRIDVTSQH